VLLGSLLDGKQDVCENHAEQNELEIRQEDEQREETAQQDECGQPWFPDEPRRGRICLAYLNMD